MKTTTVIAALAMLSSAPVLAQAPAGKSPAAAPAARTAGQDTVKLAAGKTGRSRAGEDARSCLELATNVEIIKCAEQYR